MRGEGAKGRLFLGLGAAGGSPGRLWRGKAVGGTGLGRGSFCLSVLLFNDGGAGQRAGLQLEQFQGQEAPLAETRYGNSEPGGLAGG